MRRRTAEALAEAGQADVAVGTSGKAGL